MRTNMGMVVKVKSATEEKGAIDKIPNKVDQFQPVVSNMPRAPATARQKAIGIPIARAMTMTRKGRATILNLRRSSSTWVA
jgi:hypothetical protein